MSVNQVLTKKQRHVLIELSKEDWFIAILHGAVRSGKTFVNNILFLREIKRVSEIAKRQGIAQPLYILAGFSMSNINDNVLNELSNTFGLDFKFDKYGSFTLFGVKIIQTTHGNKNGVGRIRGLTAHGAYINEASLSVQAVFEEIKTRCSGDGARIIADTNPDHPEHWLKKDYIDKADENKDIKEFSFVLDDNTFLSQRYVDNLKNATPSGMFYDRSINGMWVSAHGVVYPDFDKSTDVIQAKQPDGTPFPWWNCEEFIFGVDWGYEHTGTIVVMGRYKNCWYLVDEYAHKHKEIDGWVDIARECISKYGNRPFYCDSARPEHVDRFIREGFNAINANKSVLSGIETVSRLIKEGLFKVIQGDKDLQFMQEIYQYIWNERTGEPVKQNDDVLDAVRYALHSHTYEPMQWNISARLF